MSALFAVSNRDPQVHADAVHALSRSLHSQGFPTARTHVWSGGTLHWHATPGEDTERSALWLDRPDGFVACVGTPFVDNLSGVPALERLWDTFDSPAHVAGLDLWGSFVVAIGKQGSVWLFGDPIGMVKLYRVPARGIVSTSWLACVESAGPVSLDRLGSQEYVLLGANHGDRTPVCGIGIVDPSAVYEPATGLLHRVRTGQHWRAPAPPRGPPQAIETCVEVLRHRMRTVCSAFDGRINTALSGGFDSRLLVAALRDAGQAPHLFVYGGQDDADVRIATSIAGAEGWPIRHVDKDANAGGRPPMHAEALRAAIRFFDGIPTDGVFDRGADRDTRIAQSACGAIALNGGGGEILRNFFYLPDRTLDTLDLVRAFYHGFLRSAFRRIEERDRYIDAMRAAMRTETCSGGDTLDRVAVELVYPLVRARYWTSRNNSLAARCGHFSTPLLDPRLVPIAACLPMRWKNYGRLESAMIARLSPALGAHPTDYGFTPVQGPSRRYRMSMWLQHHRPATLREHTGAIKRLLGRSPVPAPPVDAAALLGGPRAVDALLDPRGLVDSGQMARFLTLEALVRELSIDVPT